MIKSRQRSQKCGKSSHKGRPALNVLNRVPVDVEDADGGNGSWTPHFPDGLLGGQVSLFNSSVRRLTWVNELTTALRRQALQDMRSPLIPEIPSFVSDPWRASRKKRECVGMEAETEAEAKGRPERPKDRERETQNAARRERQVRQPFKTIKAWIHSLEGFQRQARPKRGSEGKAGERI